MTDQPPRTLADIFNIPRAGETEFEGARYPVRQPTLPEEALFSRWLEERAAAWVARQTHLPESERKAHRQEVRNDAAAGVFEFGGEVCTKSLGTIEGIAKLRSITLRADGFDHCDLEFCKRMARAELEATALEMIAAADDPKVKAAVGSILAAVGTMTGSTPSGAGSTSPGSGT